MPIIEVNNVTKEYELGQLRSLKHSVTGIINGLRGRENHRPKPFKALDNLDFRVEEGEVLGIIGSNGAGKSTLLKILSRISKPTSGNVKINGSVAPLIEVGAGLIGDLTGRENIYLNGSILGMSRKEINTKFDEIVSFAELEQFVDTPIKRYSSGMQVRLGFSVATSVDAEILIVDEVLAVGDLAFQRKCFDRMEDMIKKQGKTVLLVSHNIRQVERLCSRVILLDHGRIISDGNPTKVCNMFFERSNEKVKIESAKTTATELNLTEDMQNVFVEILDEKEQPADLIEFLRPMRVRVTFEILKPLKRICFLIGIHTTDFVYLTANNTVERTIDCEPGVHIIQLNIKSMKLLPGVYSIRVWTGTPEGKVSFYGENLCTFQVFSNDHLITRQQEMGLFYLDDSWDLGAGSKAALPAQGKEGRI